MSIIGNLIKSKSIVKKMPKSKKKHSPHSRKSIQRKHGTIISQKQNVHMHLHKQRAWAFVLTPKSVITPLMIPFVPPLPMNHPFNTNVSQSTVSATVPVNPTPQPLRSLFLRHTHRGHLTPRRLTCHMGHHLGLRRQIRLLLLLIHGHRHLSLHFIFHLP